MNNFFHQYLGLMLLFGMFIWPNGHHKYVVIKGPNIQNISTFSVCLHSYTHNLIHQVNPLNYNNLPIFHSFLSYPNSHNACNSKKKTKKKFKSKQRTQTSQ